MDKESYFKLARTLAARAGVLDGAHGYFEQHRDRLWSTLNHFNLMGLQRARILEIGPFYSYTPFLFTSAGNKVSVLEGDDPATHPLGPVYEQEKIELLFHDLFESFGDTASAIRKLPYDDEQFDVVLCWETMEHFNFNPVPFTDELRRVLKKGGSGHITVPNLAKLDRRVALLFGKSPLTPIGSYVQVGREKYYGFHWREYTLAELTELFSQGGWKIRKASHLHTFENREHRNWKRNAKRALVNPLVKVFPSFGSLCTVAVEKI